MTFNVSLLTMSNEMRFFVKEVAVGKSTDKAHKMVNFIIIFIKCLELYKTKYIQSNKYFVYLICKLNIQNINVYKSVTRLPSLYINVLHNKRKYYKLFLDGGAIFFDKTFN